MRLDKLLVMLLAGTTSYEEVRTRIIEGGVLVSGNAIDTPFYLIRRGTYKINAFGTLYTISYSRRKGVTVWTREQRN